ncbi:MAG: glutamine-synthetase adenylyltransferase, partial [Massilia sp.]|nr:glutamine-synthetase adenylyltransferase [Massilia sp.]
MPPMPPASLALTSRFYQRQLAADPARAAHIEALSRLSLDRLDFGAELEQAAAPGLPLPRAMRRLRNLLVCAIIRRDLDGQADLAEVVAATTALADFAIRT